MIDPIRAAEVRALYVQMRNTLPAVLFILAYMIGATIFFNPWPPIALWIAAVLAIQFWRELLRRRFERQDPPDSELERWARRFLIQQAVAALIWGSTMVLFAHPAQPVTVALTLCCLFSVVAGAVPAQAYNPPSFDALAFGIFSIVLVRLAATGDFSYILLGVASALFGLAMAGYCRLQSRIVRESLRIRFENATLVEALRHEKQAAEAARERAERASIAKSQFLAAASHDLRQPLYALALFSAALDELQLDEEGRAVVARIHESIGVMEGLFEGLLDLSRLEAGVVQPRIAPVSVDELFDRVSQVFWPIARERGLDLRLRSDGEWIETDVALAEQILCNLLSNAIRATERGGILLAARPRGNEVRLEVWDTGKGIAEADAVRIFQEFVQIGNDERDRRKGLGLGLAIAQRAADLLGGSIQLRSRPGRGSRFVIAQPRRSPCAKLDLSPPDTLLPIAPREGGLLIVEDDVDVRLAIASLLRRWGEGATVSANAPDALAQLEAGARWRLVVSDYRLPGGTNGLDVVRSIRARHPEPVPRCVLLTGDVNPGLLAEAEALGIAVLQKPLHPDILRAMVVSGTPREIAAG